jgi:hypothetical protein
LDFSDEKPSYAVMLQNEGFLALNKRRAAHIKQKKRTKKTYSLMHLIFNLKKKEKVEIKERKIKEERKKKTTVGLGLASH